jgi:hypothetical protein
MGAVQILLPRRLPAAQGPDRPSQLLRPIIFWQPDVLEDVLPGMNAPWKFSRRAALILSLFAAALVLVQPATSRAEDAKPSPEQEAKFTTALTNATLKGRWAPVKDGQLGAEKEDSYQIVSVKKVEGDHWVVNARLQYGGQSLDLPIPAVVKWSGDTPVMLFDNINIAGYRSYSARLMVSDNSYAGTWSGGDHGGMLYGLIVREAR